MGSDRVDPDHLINRVGQLYPAGVLNHELVGLPELPDRYNDLCAKIRSELGVLERREWSSFGCGYASFLESWFYKPEQQFEAVKYDSERYSYRGVSVIFSLLEPMFAIYESEKRWSDDGGNSVLPSLQCIDHYESAKVKQLGLSVQTLIRVNGIPKVSKRTLSLEIDRSIKIESNLADGDLRLFDAFFHWMD